MLLFQRIKSFSTRVFDIIGEEARAMVKLKDKNASLTNQEQFNDSHSPQPDRTHDSSHIFDGSKLLSC
jgi:hypothetical protein